MKLKGGIPCVPIFAILLAVLQLAVGVALVTFGSWAVNTGRPEVIKFEAESVDSGALVLTTFAFHNGAGEYGKLAIAAGIVLVFSSTFIAGSLRKQSRHEYKYIIVACIAANLVSSFAIYIFCIAGSVAISRQMVSNRAYMESVWVNTVKLHRNNICEMEREMECRGFNDGDCVGCHENGNKECSKVKCAPCNNESQLIVGCYGRIPERVRKDERLTIAVPSSYGVFLFLTSWLNFVVSCHLL